MEQLDPRAEQKLSGPAWEKVRLQIETIHNALTAVSPTARGELMAIYIKYVSEETKGQPFAVLWIKTSKQLVLGLALPEPFDSGELEQAPERHTYAGVTGYLTLKPGELVPSDVPRWARMAYENVKANA